MKAGDLFASMFYWFSKFFARVWTNESFLWFRLMLEIGYFATNLSLFACLAVFIVNNIGVSQW